MTAAAPAVGASTPAGPARFGRVGSLIAAGAGVLAGSVGSVLLYRHAVRVDAQPSPAAGAPDVLVPHYATPWILAAAGAALVALLLAVTLVAELVGRRTDAGLVPDTSVRAAPAPVPLPDLPPAQTSHDPAAHPDDVWRPPAQVAP